jgi:hypothetical protein
MPNFHEDLAREDIVKGPGNRKFGLTFAGLFALCAAIAFIASGAWSGFSWRWRPSPWHWR